VEESALSPIVVIREKEIELAERLAAAKRSAERAILDAHQWAAHYRDRAEREGQADAAAFYRAELAAADADAAKIREEGEQAAAQIAARGRLALDAAVARILEIVLPEAVPVPLQTALPVEGVEETPVGRRRSKE
jgi:F-type H+-transporting ATPase subunit b